MSSVESDPAIIPERRETPLRRAAHIVMREVAWLAGCVIAATAFCFIAPEHGYDPVPFFTICLYILTGIARLFLHFFVRWLSPPK
jgi:hypothetical protein